MCYVFNLIDKVVLPILCYGVEIWGYEKDGMY